MTAAGDITSDIRIDKLFVLRRSHLKSLCIQLPRLLGRIFVARRLMAKYDVTYISTIVVTDFILGSCATKANAIIHVHEMPAGCARVVFSLLLRISNATLIFISQRSRMNFLGLSAKCQKVIWNGTRPVDLPAASSNADRELRILLIGRFNAWKGQNLLIDAIAMLPIDKRKSIRLRLLGSTFEGQAHFRDEILDNIVQHGLEEVVEVLPFDPNPRWQYAWSDIVAVPSTLPEPFGLVAIEAMSAGRAVVAANHGGLSEIVDNEVTGLKVAPGDKVAWRDALLRYINDRELVERHGHAGRKRFSEHFDESIYMRQIAETFDGALMSGAADV